jgi:putative two-component system response regulator
LTEKEIDQIKMHSSIGARIVSQMRFGHDVAPIILAHHEQWDGNGYPNRLRETDIPIGARVVAIVDAYDAMLTDRPYRPALSHQEAISRLRQARGSQFDPKTLDIFLDLIDSGRLVAFVNG